MQAMILEAQKQALELKEIDKPQASAGEILVKVSACAVCRTDLHVVDGDLTKPKLPLVPGHEIVGRVEAIGKEVAGFAIGQRVGIPWLGGTCGQCKYCLQAKENLCDKPVFTGYTKDGGYAEYTVADARFVFPLPDNYTDVEVAPLLCAGLIGWRSLKMAGAGTKIGFYGFGAAAHILMQVAIAQKRDVYVFTRDGDGKGQQAAINMGAKWAGGSSDVPPEKLDAAIIFAPVGNLLPLALKATDKGGTVVCGGIYMSDIPSFPYEILWEERVVKSVANLTREDAKEFLELAGKVKIKATTEEYHLSQANQALDDLRSGKVNGAAVLVV
jgi:propanol-preferring alcohol dehydrogenase